MKPIVLSNNRNCVGCNKCVRVCPAPMANVVTQETPDKIRVTIDQTKCIACGACIGVCNQGARFYRDDLQRFLLDLANGQSISLIATPSTRANFPDFTRLFKWLKGMGVKEIHDGSLGMELFVWANINYIKRYRPFSLISSHCPVVISYCRTYRPELIPRLSRIYSPTTLMAVYLKEKEKEKGNGESETRLGALTACIAATRDFSLSGVISYNITFQKLHEYFVKNDIHIFPVAGQGPEEDEENPEPDEYPDSQGFDTDSFDSEELSSLDLDSEPASLDPEKAPSHSPASLSLVKSPGLPGEAPLGFPGESGSESLRLSSLDELGAGGEKAEGYGPYGKLPGDWYKTYNAGEKLPKKDAPSEPTLFPIPSTLKENISLNDLSSIRIDAASGKGIYGLLDEYAKIDVDKVPMIFDVLYCRHNCDMGTGKNPENNFFQTRSVLDKLQKSFGGASAKKRRERLHAEFDATMDLEKLLRTYSDEPPALDYVSAEDLEEAFKLLGKAPDEKRHFDCGFCGSETCWEMAHKIALKTNIPINCVTKMRLVTEETNKKITAYIELIHNVSEYLLTTVGDDFSASIEHALMSLCYAMDGSSTALWKNTYDSEERPQCHRIVSFPGMLLNKHFNTVTLDDPPGWLENLVEGNTIMRVKSAMSLAEQRKFLGRNVNTLILSPIIAQGDFWGFISLLKAEETLLTEQDLSVLSVCSNILASFMIKHDFQSAFADLNETPLL